MRRWDFIISGMLISPRPTGDEQGYRAGVFSFMAFYCRGVLRLRDLSESEESTENARVALEKAAQLNPMYPPTFEALTQAYSRSAGTQAKALEAAETAVKLDPESRSYKTNLAMCC